MSLNFIPGLDPEAGPATLRLAGLKVHALRTHALHTHPRNQRDTAPT